MNDKSADPLPDCTVLCRSREHAFQLVAAITARPQTKHLQSYCRSLCHNFPLIVDQFGRNVLHLSASCGDCAFVRWLLEKCHSDVDTKDSESGWTPLHRSIFYGQIGCAKTLMQLGANPNILDREHNTPLDLLMLDRPPYIEYMRTDPCDCYVWGSNVNFNLGVETEQSRKTPELINAFKRYNISIKEVLIRKFHSLFLTNDGKVYSCGHGHGGRLGQVSEDLSIIPNLVALSDSSVCESIASGQDHNLLLVRHLKDNSVHVYSCGINTYHVLGHWPAPERAVTPKLICLKPLKLSYKLSELLGVGAARYHSLFYTKNELFTFGLNCGQLGHSKGDRTQVIPHKVSSLNFKDTDTNLEHVVTSDGAIVCATNKGDVFVLHEYQCRKVASHQFEIQQICVMGGHLDERTDVAGIHDYSRVELQIMFLTKMRNIYLWKGSDPTLVRCLIGFGRELSVTHICLNVSAVGIVTKDGEVFFGNVSNRKSVKSSEQKKSSSDLENANKTNRIGFKQNSGVSEEKERSESKSTQIKPKFGSFEEKSALVLEEKPKPKLSTKGNVRTAQQVKSFVQFINKDECHTIRLKKQHYIQRAVGVFSDDKNRNFAVLQSSPKIGLLETASKPDSQMVADLKTLFETSDLNDNIHDVVIKVGNRQYFCHKFILSSRSEYFRKTFAANPECNAMTIETNVVSIDCFDQIIKFVYYNSNDLFEDGKRLNWNQLKTKVETNSENKSKNSNKKVNNKKSNSDPLKELREASKRLGINWLYRWLVDNSVKIIGNRVKVVEHCLPPKLTFNRLKDELYDIVIKSEDNVEFKCHKCLLMARLEYFRGMLGSGWIEASSDRALTLPISSKILDILLEYVYSDGDTKLISIEEPEFICQVLVVADQYLIPRLKTLCEYVLVNLLTLKNACELLELSYIYNADQLKRCCLDFVCINLQTLIESKSFDVLSDETVNDLTECYQNLITRPHRRRISRYSSAPTAEELERIFCSFGTDDDFIVDLEEKKAILKQKARMNRSNRQRNESNSSDVFDWEDIQSSKPSLGSPKDDSEQTKNLEEKVNKSTIISKPLKQKTVETNTETSVKSKPIKWGLNSSIPAPISLKDIITEEEKELTKISKTKPNVWPNNPKHSPVVKQNPSPIPIPSKTFRNSSSKYNQMSLESGSVSPKSFAQMAVSPPKLHSNPWKTIDNMSPNNAHVSQPFLSSYPQIENISMKDIVRAEEEQIKNLKTLQTKPLNVISIEDKAIEELLEYYKANGNPDEYITVERVVSRMAEPVWSRNQ